MERYKKEEKKQELLKTVWEYLLGTGLSNSSIGELCRKTGISQSSLYHWFDNKDDIWINAGKYGLSRVVECLFDYTFNSTDDINSYFAAFLDEVDKLKEELRLAIEITTSSAYGERMRGKSREFRIFYSKYAQKLIEQFNCSLIQANVFIYTIISIVIDYIVWDDRDIAQMLLNNLRARITQNLGI